MMYDQLFAENIHRNKTALEAPNRTPLSYYELSEMIINIKTIFDNLPLNTSDPVALVLPNGPDLGVMFLACACFSIAAPLNPNYTKNEFLFFLKDLKARALVIATSKDSAAKSAAEDLEIPIIFLTPKIKAGQFDLRIDSFPTKNSNTSRSLDQAVSLLLHTSGTTSKPKLETVSTDKAR